MSYRHFADVKCIKFIVLCELRTRPVSAVGNTFFSSLRSSFYISQCFEDHSFFLHGEKMSDVFKALP